MSNSRNLEVLVSCCIPAYNHEAFIEEAILSIVNQDYQNIELIVINDGSLDSTHDVILSLEDVCKKRFKRFFYLNRENRGVCYTMNQLIELAHGEYIAFSASDDVSYPQRISRLLHAYESLDNSYCAVFADAGFINSHSETVSLGMNGAVYGGQGPSFSSALKFNCRNLTEGDADGYDFSYGGVLKDNFIPGISFLYRRSCLLEVGCYAEGICIEDWDLYLKLLKKYRFFFLDEKLSAYRIHGGNAIFNMRLKLLMDSFLLLEREESFSKAHGFSNEWKKSYANNLLRLLKLRQWSKFFVFFRRDVSFFKDILGRFLRRLKRFSF